MLLTSSFGVLTRTLGGFGGLGKYFSKIYQTLLQYKILYDNMRKNIHSVL